MNQGHREKLEQFGLSTAEAQIYLAVLQNGPLTATAIASETGIQRTNVYPTLCSLADKGLVEGGTGYGSKFAAVSPRQALPSLIVREKHTLSERERIADELAESLAPLAADVESALDDMVQVIRTPQVISERFHRLQLEAKRQVELVVKGPIINPGLENPGQQKAQRRGVHYRCLYERAVTEDPKIMPYIEGWIGAGEEARVYNGELPYKVAVFDSQVVLLILVRRTGQSSALLVRHEPFAKSISVLFDSFWNEAKPFTPTAAPAKSAGRLSKNKSNTRRSAAAALNGETNNRAARR